MGPQMEVPRISWDHLDTGKETGQDSRYIVYEGCLHFPEGSLPVVYKMGRLPMMMTSDDFMEEAQILLALQRLTDVPTLYGVTAKAPFALVMSLMPGIPLKKFQRSATARTYLASLREVCLILGRVHRKGVVHCDVNDFTIIVEAVGNTEDVNVSLIGFDHAVFPVHKDVCKLDSNQLMDLVRVMGNKLDNSSDLFEHREKLLVEEELNLTGILRLLCSVLHGDPEQCGLCKNLRPGN